MNENLAEMVNQTTETPNEEVEMPSDVETQVVEESNSVPPQQTQQNSFDIPTIMFSDWYYKNKENFNQDEIKDLPVKSSDIIPGEYIVFKMLHHSGDILESGEYRKGLALMKDCHEAPVLDLKGLNIIAYKSDIFQIIYETSDPTVFIKFYGLAAKQAVFCKLINDSLVPYAVKKLKKKDIGIEMIQPPEDIEEKLSQDSNMEDIIIRYKQIEKSQEGLITNQDVINYFMEKVKGVIDINHLLQIDNVIISIVG